MFVGSRAEYFAVNLGPIFDLVNFVPVEGDNDPVYGNGTPFPGGITQSQDNQELIGKKNVTSIAMEIPIACLVGSRQRRHRRVEHGEPAAGAPASDDTDL